MDYDALHPPAPITTESATKGETVARAKKTDRAEARRRYRAEMSGEFDTDAAEMGSEVAAETTTRSAAKNSKFSSPSGRMSIKDALRESVHPVDVRADLAALPWLVTHTKAVWLPILISIGSAVAFVAVPSSITVYLFQFFVLAPAIGSIFLAGFLAPRASWLIGIIVGVAASLILGVLLLSGGMNHALTTLGGAPYDPATYSATIIQSVILAIPLGGLFAAAAAWYRRFLQLSNPNRGRKAEAKKSGGNDGRSRNASASKAQGARR